MTQLIPSTACNCFAVCRPAGLWQVAGKFTIPAPAHLPSCHNYRLERYVRVAHGGSSMLMTPAEVAAMVENDCGDDAVTNYELTEVMLTPDQFLALPESAGF